MAKRQQRIQDLTGLLNSLYPASLAEEWDNVGLQVGEAAAPLDKVMIALDPSGAAVEAAADAGAQALVTHHPLLLKPLRRLTPDDMVGGVVWRAVRAGVAIVSVHTNLDTAADGLNRWLAERLELSDSQPLQPVAGDFLKLVVFVPAGYEKAVAEALFAGGAGQIGAYDQCSFRTPGIGTFRPGDSTDPFIGTRGELEEVEELRLETIVPRPRLGRVLERLFKAHPYEEVAYDLFPLANQVPAAGLGRIGRLAAATTLDDYAARVKTALGCSHLRLVGEPGQSVRKVAVCGGSGAGLVSAAHQQGADLLITGDIKYHDARLAEELGLALIDAGHFGTERLMVEHLHNVLQQSAEERGWEVSFQPFEAEADPFRVC